jgi:ribulose-phosphate 3-epimerase
VAPSILAADFTHLEREIRDMERAGADLFHLDVMDGHFVPNLTFGPLIVAAVRRCTDLPLDAHLMIEAPERFLDPFARAGANALTIHVEAAKDVQGALARIRALGVKCGLSLNPGTDLEEIRPYLDMVDLLLVMSVQPGFGGQAFQPSSIAKVVELNTARSLNGYNYAISIDGGIVAETAIACRGAGADILVSGTYLFRARDRSAAIRSLKGVKGPG